jgi:hypothetical protein
MKKKMVNNEEQKTTELNGIPAEVQSTKQLAESIEQLRAEIAREQTEIQSLKKQLRSQRPKSTILISIVFGVPGILALIFSKQQDHKSWHSSA